jgi:hypothetical protein
MRIIIGSHLWIENPDPFGEWIQLQSFKDGYSGIVDLKLVEEIGEVQESKLNGRPVYKIDVSGDVELILRQFLMDEVTAVQLVLDAESAEASGVIWIDQESSQILRTDTEILIDDAELSITHLFSEFNEPVTVIVPLDEELSQLVKDYIVAVKEADVDGVKSVVTTQYQENVTFEMLEDLRREEFRAFIDFDDIFVLSSTPIIGREAVPIELRGLLYYEGTDRTGIFSAFMIKEAASWKIDEIELYADILISPFNEEVNTVLDEFFNHLKAGEGKAAWSLFSSSAQSAELYEQVVLGEEFVEQFQDYDSVDLTDLTMTNVIQLSELVWGEFAIVEGLLNYNDGRTQELRAVLERDEERWQIININLPEG